MPGDCADLDVAESEFVPLIEGDCVLVQAGRKADSVGKMDSEQLDGVFFEGGGSAGNEALLDEVHRQVVRPLGVHSEREGAQDRGVQIHRPIIPGSVQQPKEGDSTNMVQFRFNFCRI